VTPLVKFTDPDEHIYGYLKESSKSKDPEYLESYTINWVTKCQ
jgi:hypothetical protein